MPKSRGTGAAKPYTYWSTYTVNGQQKRVQRWKVQLDLGYDAAGKRIRKTFTGKTSSEVKSKLKAAREEYAATGSVGHKDIKLGEYAQQWLEHKSHDVDPKSMEMYRTVVDKHLAKYAGTSLSKIVPSTVRRILEQAQAYDQKGQPKGPAGLSLRR